MTRYSKDLVYWLVTLVVVSPASTAVAQTGTWKQLPLDGGTFEHLVVAPSDPSIVYAGADGAGLFRSDDGGDNWRPVNTGRTATVSALAVDPEDPNHVYVGTRDGVYRSLNGGVSWTLRGENLFPTAITKFAIDPQRPSTVYAIAWRIFRSDDRGFSWSEINAPARIFRAFAVDPRNSSTLYAANSLEIFKSMDGGQTWALFPDTIPNPRELIIHPVDNNVLYCATANGVYTSTDSGTIWESTSLTADTQDIAVDPMNPSILYAATIRSGLFKSIDAGETWQAIRNGLEDLTAQQIDINRHQTNVIYSAFGSGVGVAKSLDHGESWHKANQGLRGHKVIRLVIDPDRPSTIYLASTNSTYDNIKGGGGIYRTTDRGINWTRLYSDTPSDLEMSPSDNSTLYAASNETVLASRDYGESWDAVDPGLGEITDLAVAPSDPLTLYITSRFHPFGARSVDGGVTWSVSSFGNGINSASKLAVDLHEADIVYLAYGSENGIYKSIDGGDSWAFLDGTQGRLFAGELVINPNRPSDLYAVYTFETLTSSDYGATWDPLPEFPIFVGSVANLSLAPNHPSLIYNMNELWIHRSDDAGITWERIDGDTKRNGSGSNVNFIELAVDPQDSMTIFAGTISTGVYKFSRDLSLTLGKNISALPQSLIQIPLILSTGGENVGDISFAIDIAESHLSFNNTDADGDHLPDGLRLNLPPNSQVSAYYDATELDGEIYVSLSNVMGNLPSGRIGTLELYVPCQTVGSGVTAHVRFANDPAPSFVDHNNVILPGDWKDGSVTIQPADCAGDGELVTIDSPNGGEIWPVSSPDELITKSVKWSLRSQEICHTEVMLLVSTDEGEIYKPTAPGGGLPQTFDVGPGCQPSRESIDSLEYTVPTTPPGEANSLYKIQVRVTGTSGQSSTARSDRPFFIKAPDPSRETLVLWHRTRMEAAFGDVEATASALEALVGHDQVNGHVIDLGAVATLDLPYDEWDHSLTTSADEHSRMANEALFGPGGVQEHLLDWLEIFPDVRYLILVGDDRMIPLTRLRDQTTLFTERNYTNLPGDLKPDTTTVGLAATANNYLSDDPLATTTRQSVLELNDDVIFPDLAVGRLVESPEEIAHSIQTFIDNRGELDFAALDSAAAQKILVTGYDFLGDSADNIHEYWNCGLPGQSDALIGQDWSADDLEHKLCGNAAIVSLNGHATHYLEGFAGARPLDILGYDTSSMIEPNACMSGPLDLSGQVIYAVGCHGGLPVASTDDDDHPIDLPQALLSRGAMAYIANTGYGWGINCGVGYSERLVEIMTEQFLLNGTLKIGDAVRQSKLEYFLENQRFDIFDFKTLMQWTLYGFPMYEVKTGIPADNTCVEKPSVLAATVLDSGEQLTVESKAGGTRDIVFNESLHTKMSASVPDTLTLSSITLPFEENEFTKHRATGLDITDEGSGCPISQDGEPLECGGCYYRFRGHASGEADLPIMPTWPFSAHYPGKRLRGVIWMGSVYKQEGDWRAVFGHLISNGGDGSIHGVAPRAILFGPTIPKVETGVSQRSKSCNPDNLGSDHVVLTIGETLKNSPEDRNYTITRRHLEVNLDLLYTDLTDTDNFCDTQGPLIGTPHHYLQGQRVYWTIPVTDASDVWRAVLVYDDSRLDPENQGAWRAIELTEDTDNRWHGSLDITGLERLTYVIQAIDSFGNVQWLQFVDRERSSGGGTALYDEMPSSRIPLEIPLPVDIELTSDESLIFSDGFESGDIREW